MSDVNITHRLDPAICEDACHNIIEFIDKLPLSEPEKLAAFGGNVFTAHVYGGSGAICCRYRVR